MSVLVSLAVALAVALAVSLAVSLAVALAVPGAAIADAAKEILAASSAEFLERVLAVTALTAKAIAAAA